MRFFFVENITILMFKTVTAGYLNIVFTIYPEMALVAMALISHIAPHGPHEAEWTPQP